VNENLDLRNIVDLQVLQEVQDKFAEATGVAAIIADSEGQAITKPSNFSRFCRMIRSSSEGVRRCFESDGKAGREAARLRKPYIHYCHAGLIDLAAPVIVDGVYLGSVLCGQVLLRPPDSEYYGLVRQRVGDLGLDVEALLDAFREIEVVREDRVKASAELLHIMANYIVSAGVAKLTQQKLMTEMKIRAELEKTLKTLELKALQSQVNPHFLFNTLNAVIKQAFLENAELTQEIVYALSKLLRYNLRRINQMVPLREEIGSIRDYLFIQKTRFGDHITFSIGIPEELMEVRVPLMMLQPLVENAIVHGIEPKIESGHVAIRGLREGQDVVIEVADTGIGMSEERLREVLAMDGTVSGKGHTTGIGIANVHKRLQHQFGPQYGLTLESREGQGTTVRVRVPLRYGEEKAHDGEGPAGGR
jgi:ligand-binding sensor protein/anti-sigma regulatory factor (Ser/Thr protein kinase)